VRAAQIVRLSPSTLRLRACGDGEHKALFRPADPSPLTLSFNNLVESFVLASMRRVHRVSMQKVRKALQFIGDRLGVERPLIHARFRTDGVRLFVHEADRLPTYPARGKPCCARSSADARAAQPKSIVVDPRRGFG
jgi:hypothetical protein